MSVDRNGYSGQRARMTDPGTRWQRTVTAHLDADGLYHESWDDWRQVDPTVPLAGRIANKVGMVIAMIGLLYIVAIVLATTWCQPT